MHILSALKQHVASVAGGSSSADGRQGAAAEPSEARHTHRTLRNVFAAGESRSKHRRQPCPPPLTVQTSDISWPVGSGDRDSLCFDELDLLSPSEARPRTPLSATCMSASAVCPPPLRRAMSISRPVPRASSAHSRTGSRGPKCLSAGTLYAATVTMRPCTSAALATRAPQSTPTTCDPPVLRSPGTPASTFTFVDIHSPVSPLCTPPAGRSNSSSSSSGRIHRRGTLTSAIPTRGRSPSPTTTWRNALPTRRPLDGLYQSLTSLDLSQSTTSTVVAAALSAADRPASTRSKGSLNGATLVPDQLPKSAADDDGGSDDDALRGTPPRDDWDIVLDRIKEYRASHEAPVDTVGCEALTEEEKDPKLRRFRSLVSLMLSAQTRDEITADAVRTLSQRLPGGLTPRALSEAPIDLIHECVRRVGFWQRKANYIKEAARTCLEQYDGDIPRTVPQLLSLPGVGPKMAYLAMHAAWQDTQGIGVDTHVLRITHRLGWVHESARTPEATRHALESWMPRSLWREINPLLVGLGQTVCRGVGPKCDECPVNRFCPSAQVRRRPSTSRRGTSRGSARPAAHSAVMSDTGELGDVDVEDLASMVRGAEHAVRSRKLGMRGQQAGALAVAAKAFPEIPESPLAPTPPANTMHKARARAASRLRLRQTSSPAANHGCSDTYDEKDTASDTDGMAPPLPRTTAAASPYFMRLRSNAASEMVRPEAKTDSVRIARARASAGRSYSRRLSRSDMQWALGEDWDPDDSSSLSSLSDVDIPAPSDDERGSAAEDNLVAADM
ncbi:alpha,alpha-trehalase nth1 [Coemansia spiralis]|nr:alpha,alpha-trehalase nth1 [Coemansia spiralis]